MELVVGIVALLGVWWVFFHRVGNIPFWKLVSKHPDEAYQFFLREKCWFVDELPTNIDKIDLVGPVYLFVPSLSGKRVKVYCLAEEIRDSQESFRGWLAARQGGQNVRTSK